MNRRIQYLRARNGTPVGCLAIMVDRDNMQASYQLSVLNPVDQFDRKVARQLAMGRLVEEPITVSIAKNATMHDISLVVMNSVARESDDNKTPSRAVKAARRWLQDTVERF